MAEGPSFPAGLISLGEQSKAVFVVDKTRRFLRVYDFEAGRPHLLSEVPSDIGKNSGEKMRANDAKTPTGIYFLLKRLGQPDIPFGTYGSLAFTSDYPNIFDRRDNKGGSGIWLHAVPDSVPLTRGSRGCVVVRDEVIKKLADFVHLKQTPLVIYDSVEEVDQEKFDAEQQKYLGFFEQWRKAWETEDVDTYMKFYDPTFKNSQMDFDHWYKHKKKLKGLYKFIQVKLSPPLIVRNRDQVVIRTLQEYHSDLHTDYGLKTIHARWSPENGFKIIREDWEPRTEPTKSAQDSQQVPSAQNALPRTPTNE